MNQARVIINDLARDKKSTLLFLIAVLALFTFPFSICSLVVSGTANAGFNVVLTAILNSGFVSGAYFVVNKSKTPIAIGFVLGASVSMIIMNFETAIYWGQLSRCTIYVESFDQYSCSQRSAYGAVSAFAVLLLLTLVPLTVLLFIWRGDLIDESELYHQSTSSSGNTTLDSSSSHYYNPVLSGGVSGNDASMKGRYFVPSSSLNGSSSGIRPTADL